MIKNKLRTSFLKAGVISEFLSLPFLKDKNIRNLILEKGYLINLDLEKCMSKFAGSFVRSLCGKGRNDGFFLLKLNK